MSYQRQHIAVSTASLLYGVVSILVVLLPVTADEFTIRNVVSGGAVVGVAAMMTYFFKEVVHREADREETLGFSDYLRELTHSLPVLIFPVAAIAIGVVGLVAGLSAGPLIDGLFYFGLAIVCGAAFISSYLVHEKLFSASLRASVWVSVCVFLLVIKKLA